MNIIFLELEQNNFKYKNLLKQRIKKESHDSATAIFI